MRHTTTQALYAYWNAVRRGRIAPRRLEIQPSHIADVLPETFILECIDAKTFRFRLAGTRTCIRLARDLRGANFLSLWSEADRSLLEHHLGEITDLGRVGLFTIEALDGAGRARTIEISILPLMHTGASIDRLLCSLCVLDDEGNLDDDILSTMKLMAAEMIWPEGHPNERANPESRQSPLLPHIRNARIVRQNRRQFRVYDGGLCGEPVTKS